MQLLQPSNCDVSGESWPSSRNDLLRLQQELRRARPSPWHPGDGIPTFGACFAAFPKGRRGPGRSGEPGWAAAVLADDRRVIATEVRVGTTGGPYEPGLLALREGRLLESTVKALPRAPDVLLVDATGRDHPRRAGLALHLGAVLGIPTVGVTQRVLQASGPWPAEERHASSPLQLDGELVGYWLRTRPGTRPVAIHAAWRTDPEVALAVVKASLRIARTPEPLRRARRAARLARAGLIEGELDRA